MVDMRALTKRYAEVKQAEVDRNNLLDELFQKVDDMQKTMDRNAFIMVLIDGDCMKFLNELVRRGVSGGDQAAKLLKQAVIDYLRYDEDFKYDHKIVIRVYANLRGLSKTYVDKGILPNTAAFHEFVLGFNKAHPLCDFIDAGNHKEAADTKLKETLNLYVYNVHCKQIIFGASADNGYASFLSSFFVGTDVSSRIRILKGPPFSYEFKTLLPQFKWTEFTNVFRSDFISHQPVQHLVWRRSQELESQHAQDPAVGFTVDNEPVSSSGDHQGLYATNTSISEVTSQLPKELTIPSRPRILEVDHNGKENGVRLGKTLQQGLSPSASSTSSGPTLQGHNGELPTASEAAAALIASTNEFLQLFPKNLDFGAVKQQAAQRLGVTSDFWLDRDGDEWFSRSKNIIKMTVEDWIERTDNPPPGNATWMLRYFNRRESPSAIMRSQSSQFWRTTIDLDLDLNFSTSDAETANSHVSDQSKPVVKPGPPSRDPINADVQPSPVPEGRKEPLCVYQNYRGQRVDMPNELNLNPPLIHDLRHRQQRLCNAHHLLRSCPNEKCPYDHASVLTDDEFEALLCISRSVRCPFGSACTDVCFKGHMCPYGRKCRYGADCKFADLHDIDDREFTEFEPRFGWHW